MHCIAAIVGCGWSACQTRTMIVVRFVFKQKTAYEIEYGLVVSEMCIRDRMIATSTREGLLVARKGSADMKLIC